jgi:hypothetical protein
MLPQDYDFLAYLQERHNVKLTPEDLQELAIFHHDLRQRTLNKLANDPNAVFYDVQNGKVLAILAFAAIGFFAAPLLGVGGIVGALMGAAIGFRLFGSKGKKEEEEKTPAQAYGFDSVASLPSIGGPIPLLYGNRDLNPTGGVLTAGFVVNSRVETRMGNQKLYQLSVLGYGKIGAIDENKITINDQPRDNFFVADIVTKTSLGTPNQGSFPEFPYYSQAISPGAQNQMGLDSRVTIEANANSSTIVLKEEDVPAFSPADQYRHNGVSFRVVAKTSTSVVADKVINQVDNLPIYAVWDVKYTTTKRINEIQVNLNAQYWASKQDEDKNIETVDLANVWDIYLTQLPSGVPIKLARIHIKSKTRTNLRRTFSIANLPLGKYKLELRTITQEEQPTNDLSYALRDDGVIRSYPVGTGWVLSMEGGITENVRANNDYKERTQWAAQGGAPCQITSVNEIVYPSAIGQLSVVGYPNMPMVGLIATASAQLQGTPNMKMLVRQARSNMKVIGGSYIAAPGSQDNIMFDNAGYISAIIPLPNCLQVGFILRNLDKRTESTITGYTGVNPAHIVTAQSCNWEPGDRFLIYHYGCSNYFPDIYVDTLTSFDGGLGNFIDADFFVDYNSIMESKIYCIGRQFFWDGQITEPVAWSQWATRESLGSLLFPSRIGGRFALIPERPDQPKRGLFNASNIIEGSFSEEFGESQDLNTLIVSYKDGSDANFNTATLTIQTMAAYNGEVPVVEESLNLDSVTNFYQAEKVGQVYLKTRLLQDRAITFKTGLQGAYLQPGDLIIVQHLLTEFEKDCSGFVQSVTTLTETYNGGVVCDILLSAPVKIGVEYLLGYEASIFRLGDGGMQLNVPVNAYLSGDQVFLRVYGLPGPLQGPGENRTGDYIVITKQASQKRTYRISTIDPQPDGTISISAVLWVPEMLEPTGLITVA